jgi:hypothetical protein
MSITYQTYILSIDAVEDTSNLDSDFNSAFESNGWNQYFDIETQTIINLKNRHRILKPCIQFNQSNTNQFLKRKKQKSKDIGVLESIKEDPALFEDIETGKIYKNVNAINEINANIEIYSIKLEQILITSVFYISHLALIIFLFKI